MIRSPLSFLSWGWTAPALYCVSGTPHRTYPLEHSPPPLPFSGNASAPQCLSLLEGPRTGYSNQVWAHQCLVEGDNLFPGLLAWSAILDKSSTENRSKPNKIYPNILDRRYYHVSVSLIICLLFKARNFTYLDFKTGFWKEWLKTEKIKNWLIKRRQQVVLGICVIK